MPVLRGREGKEAADNRPKRLFSKNTGVCKVAIDDV